MLKIIMAICTALKFPKVVEFSAVKLAVELVATTLFGGDATWVAPVTSTKSSLLAALPFTITKLRYHFVCR